VPRLNPGRGATAAHRGNWAVGNGINGRNKPGRPELIVWAMRTGVPLGWLQNGESPHPEPDGGLVVRHQGLEPRTR